MVHNVELGILTAAIGKQRPMHGGDAGTLITALRLRISPGYRIRRNLQKVIVAMLCFVPLTQHLFTFAAHFRIMPAQGLRWHTGPRRHSISDYSPGLLPPCRLPSFTYTPPPTVSGAYRTDALQGLVRTIAAQGHGRHARLHSLRAAGKTGIGVHR
jgi:hypothetical protein